MPLNPKILEPITDDQPAGLPLHYSPLFDEVKEARRFVAEVKGDWAEPGKVADYPKVIQLCEDALATKTKDLQLAAWLTDALLKTTGFGGLSEGLDLSTNLVEKFWDSVHPLPDEDGMESRAAPLNSLGSKTQMQTEVKMRPLSKAGHTWFEYKEAYSHDWEKAKKPADRDRLKAVADAAKDKFEKAFTETPKAFYAGLEKDLDRSRESLRKLALLCEEKFGDARPSLSKFMEALDDVRHTVHLLLERKREIEPDPVEAVVEAQAQEAVDSSQPSVPRPASGAGSIVIPFAASEPADRRAAIAAIATQAAFLRKQRPGSPAPYLMMRGLRWGELREAAARSDPTWLEPPPTELRQRIKLLALSGKWEELLETAENAMSLPCSRAWLDLQRFVVEACVALGPDYHEIASAIQTQLRVLLTEVPQILDATLMDDTPTANSRTRAWIQGFMHGQFPVPVPAAPPSADGSEAANPAPPAVNHNGTDPWKKPLMDSYSVAKVALAAGDNAKAISILQVAVESERSGRGRFQRKMELVRICADAKKPDIAQLFLGDLERALSDYKLEEWEDRDFVVEVLLLLMKHSRRAQDAAEKAKLFERICRLDPAKASESQA